MKRYSTSKRARSRWQNGRENSVIQIMGRSKIIDHHP